MKKYVPKVSNHKMMRVISKLNRVKNRFRRPKPEPVAKSLIVIENVLEEARDFKLDSEVVLYALMYMRDNPDCQISEAMVMGYEEWIK